LILNLLGQHITAGAEAQAVQFHPYIYAVPAECKWIHPPVDDSPAAELGSLV